MEMMHRYRRALRRTAVPALGAALALALLARGAGERGDGGLQGLRYGFLPAQGEPRLLVVLAETPDRPHTLSADTVKAMIFGRGAGPLSLAGYYEQVSYGALRVRGDVTPWLMLPRTMAQYAGKNYGINFRSWPDNLGGFAADAVAAAVKAGVDLSSYDNDGDGHVDGLMIVHSGPGGEVGKRTGRLWSRVDYVSNYGGEPIAADGVVVDRFAACPEYITRGRPDAMRLCAHEFGHLMGLPDLYDPDGSSLGIGDNGIMGILVHPKIMAEPPAPCAFSRELLGWSDPDVVTGATNISLRPAALSPDLVRVNTPAPGDYFLIEYRAPVGVDAGLAGDGLLIWHANDRAVYNNFFECAGICSLRPRLKLMQADGRDDLEHKRRMADAADFFPGPGGEHEALGVDTGSEEDPFRGATTLTWSGAPSGIRVSSIKVADGRATARIVTDDSAVPVHDHPWPVLSSWKWEEIKGNGNGWAEPGERMKIELTITNLGQEARGITVIPSSPLVKWRGKARLGGLKPGESSRLELSLTVPGGPGSRAMDLFRSAFTNSPPPAKKEAPAPEEGDTATTPIPLSARFAASWFEPEIKVRTRNPDMSRTIKPRLCLGVPPVLVINDAPHNLGPYVALALEPLKIPYAVVDVEQEGLPERGKIAAPPLVLWLGGVRELESRSWPDAVRMDLMQAVTAAGHVLVFSTCHAGGTPPPRIMELFGLQGIGQGAGITFARPGTKGGPIRALFFKQPYPYYPDLTPHLILTPAGDDSVLFSDFAGRTTVAARGRDPLDEAEPDRSTVGSAVFFGFPLEALKPGSIAQFVTVILNHLAP